MDAIRVTAKTVEDAIIEASIQLGTSSDNIEYTVIEKGSSGFFGIGGRKAVIEAKKKFTDEDLMKEVFGDLNEKPKKEYRKEYKKEEGKKEFRKEKKESAFAKEKPKAEAFKTPAKEASGVSEKNAAETSEKMSGKTPEKEHVKAAVKSPEKEISRNVVKPLETESAKNETKSPEKASVKETGREFGEEQAKKEIPEEAVKTPRVPADPQEAIRRAETFLKELFRTMEMSVEISSVFEDDTLSVDITGEDMGILIGKRGQTLDSLQYLTSLVVNRGKASYVRVKLDTEDYRNRRKATLENLAKNIAFKVKKTRRPVFLEPMNPYERRIIHSALQNDPYVTTHSEGEEPCRKVVVTLRKDRPRGPERDNRENRDNRDNRRYDRRHNSRRGNQRYGQDNTAEEARGKEAASIEETVSGAPEMEE